LNLAHCRKGELLCHGKSVEKGGARKKLAQLSFINTVEFPPPNISIISNIQHLPLYKSECFLRKKYLEEKLSARQIAAIVVSARSTVLKHLKGYQIPLRSEDEALLHNKGQLGYGERLVNGKVIIHKGELENIEKIKTLRGQGHSYWEIASIFNSMNIPTKNQGSRWHPTTVMKILKAQEQIESKTIDSGKITKTAL
jgi:hypothetical protein